MTSLRKVFVFAAILLPGLALADDTLPDARSLATVEAILDYCAKVDPPAASKYQDQIKLMAQGANDDELAKVRKSDEYLQQHASMDEFLAKVDEHNAKKVCAQHLVQSE